MAELIADPTTVVGASDAGAHLQMMCGAGDSTLLLTEHVRDRGDLDRGSGRAPAHRAHRRPPSASPTAAWSRRAAPATSWCSRSTSSPTSPTASCTDLPGGAPRLTRPPGGFRATAVAGIVTQEGGVATGARPAGPLDAG